MATHRRLTQREAALAVILVVTIPVRLGVLPLHGRTDSRATDTGSFALVEPFSIEAETASELSPGSAANLRITIDNPHQFAISVTSLTVDIVGSASCSGPGNFSVTRPFRGPVVVPPGRSLLPPSSSPQIVMHNLTEQQDQCKRSAIALKYTGSARRA